MNPLSLRLIILGGDEPLAQTSSAVCADDSAEEEHVDSKQDSSGGTFRDPHSF